MPNVRRQTIGACVVLPSATAAALFITCLLMDRPVRDLVLLSVFLLVSGGITALGGALAVHWELPSWVRSLRARLVLMCVMTAVLGLANAGFITYLMFLSAPDLAILAGLLGFSLGVSVFVAFTLSASTTGSISDVLATLRFMNTGSLDVRVPVRSRDEVGELAAAVNAMAQRLETSFARERNLVRAQNDLIRAVSHDLRTPLASIRAMVESINDGVVDDPETVRRYLRSTQSEVENLSQLINDLFELSLMDAGGLELHVESASIADLISDTIESMSARARAHRLVLAGRVDDDLPTVMMDPQRVQRVLNNLVHNAIRHTPRRGPSSSGPGTSAARCGWTSSTPARGSRKRSSPGSSRHPRRLTTRRPGLPEAPAWD